jgi:hypothetical protein
LPKIIENIIWNNHSTMLSCNDNGGICRPRAIAIRREIMKRPHTPVPARGVQPLAARPVKLLSLQHRAPMDRVAAELPDQDIVDTSRKRRCLMCHGAFASAWPGERICTKCKTGSAWRQGVGWSSANSRF